MVKENIQQEVSRTMRQNTVLAARKVQNAAPKY